MTRQSVPLTSGGGQVRVQQSQSRNHHSREHVVSALCLNGSLHLRSTSVFPAFPRHQKATHQNLVASFSLPMSVRTAWEMMSQSRQHVLSTGCSILDRHLGGGLRPGITELSGESATGKSQFVMQLLFQVQLPIELGGLDGAALYLSSEGALPEKRLIDIMNAYQNRYDWTKEHNYRDSIYVEKLDTIEDQHNAIFHKLPHLLRTAAGQNVRLVVLDSITAFYRAGVDDFNMNPNQTPPAQNSNSIAAAYGLSSNGTNFRARAASFLTLSAHLRRLSEEHSMPIVVINQVSDYFEPDSCSNIPDAFNIAHFARRQARMSSFSLKQPALGLAWANCVNTRLFLTRTNTCIAPVAAATSLPNKTPKFQIDPDTEAAMSSLADCLDDNSTAAPISEPRRELHVIFSPCVKSASCRFSISADGVQGIEECQ